MKMNRFALVLLMFPWLVACGGKDSSPDKLEVQESAERDAIPIVNLDREQRELAGIRIDVAQNHSLLETISIPGRLVFDERRVAHLTARVPGRVEQVYAFLGDRVGKDALLATIYSPDYLAAQAEIIQAEERLQVAMARRDSLELRMARAIFESARRKLLVMGATEKDIEEVTSTHVPKTFLEIHAPYAGTITETNDILGHFVDIGATLFHLVDISRLWMLADVYEKDLAKIKPGLTAEVQVPAYPGEKFPGRLTTLFDVLDETSRTVKARIEVENPTGRLKPQMFGETHILVDGNIKGIVVSAESVVKENGKTFVFVALNDTTFERREVSLGSAVDSFIEVRNGLKQGERVVTKGSFQLKSELLKEAFAEEE